MSGAHKISVARSYDISKGVGAGKAGTAISKLASTIRLK